MSVKPQRRFRLEVTIEGDEWADVEERLHEVLPHVLEHGPICTALSAGPSSSGLVRIVERAGLTHAAYFAELHAYLDELEQRTAPVAVATKGTRP